MNFEKLFETQKQLDEKIYENRKINNLTEKKQLALNVELGELANELPEIFKYWSNKKNNYKKALEEYVDCLHFILSIGIDLNEHLNARKYELLLQENKYYTNADIRMLILKLQSFGYGYLTVLNDFLKLGKAIGFTYSQIEYAYYKKNKVNHQRQENGY